MNEHNFNYSIKERIQNRKEWVNYFSECLLHHNINDKVTNEFYKERPILSFIFMIYFLPINLAKYLSKLKISHYHNKCKKEVEILKRELEESEKAD